MALAILAAIFLTFGWVHAMDPFEARVAGSFGAASGAQGAFGGQSAQGAFGGQSAQGAQSGHGFAPRSNADERRFYIQNTKSKLVLDLRSKSTQEFTEVIMAQKDGSISQMWTYSEYAIINSFSGLVLSVKDLGKPVNNEVVVKTWDTGNDKKWIFEPDGFILTAHWNHVLTQLDNVKVVGTHKGLGARQKFERIYF